MWITIALALTTLASAGEPSISGRFALDESPDALKAAHAAAVDQAMSQLPWAFRPFARSRLEGAVRNCRCLELRLDASLFRSQCDGDGAVSHDRAAPVGSLTGEDGKTYEVKLVTAADSATISFSGKEGGQRTTYAPQPDGALLLTKELFSPHLPRPVSWTVRYRPQP